MRLHCPRDAQELVIREAEGHIGHVCSKCTGLWLPFKFLNSIQHSYEYSLESLQAEIKAGQIVHSSIRCPEGCGQLTGAKVGNNALDHCAACHGIWFDREELRSILTLQRTKPVPTGYGPMALTELVAIVVGFFVW